MSAANKLLEQLAVLDLQLLGNIGFADTTEIQRRRGIGIKAAVKAYLADLEQAERLEVIEGFCGFCGGTAPCRCEFDERIDA